MVFLKKILTLVLAAALSLGPVCASAESNHWLCPSCDAENAMNFCTQCGTAKPEKITCPDCETTYPPDSAVLFCGNCGTRLLQDVSTAPRYEGEGFSSPEEAITHYLEGLKNQDLEQMLQAFAWETQMDHFSFEAYYESTPYYAPVSRPRIPAMDGIMYAANLHSLRSLQTEMIYNALEVYILGADYPQGKVVSLTDPEERKAFLLKFDHDKLEQLAGLTNIRFVSPDSVTDNRFSDEVFMQRFAQRSAHYGADEVINLMALADVGKETLYFCPTVARYGDRWYLVSCGSVTNAVLGIPAATQAFLCGEGALEDLIP